MENRNPNIELPIRRNQPQPVTYNELPRDEEEDHQDPQIPLQNPPLLPQNPPQRPQNATQIARFQAWLTLLFGRDLEKAMRRAIRLILFCHILGLILLCPIIYDYYTEVRSKAQIRGALEFMSANLKADPIMDLQRINKNSTCPADFEPLTLSHWPGTVAGYITNCSDRESGECRIPMTNSMEIKEWDSSLWCGKRAVLGQDYVKKAECPIGYKECYNGGCFKGECPITKVEMDSKGDIVIAKTKGELPLIKIQTSSNDIPCFNRDFSAKSNSSYNLIEGEDLANKGCDKYGFDDKYSTKLTSKVMFDSYTQDSWKDSTRNLPYFEKYTKGTTSVLSWRVRMKTAKSDYCLDLDQDMPKISTRAFRNSFLPDVHLKVIPFFYLLVPLSLVICRCYLGKIQFERSLENIIKFTCLICLSIAAMNFPGWLIFYTGYYFDLRMAHKYFAKFDDLGCFGESQGGRVIQDLLWMLEKGETSFYVIWGFFFSNTLPVLVAWWHLWMKKRIQASVRAYILNLPRI